MFYLKKAECFKRLGNFEGMRDTALQLLDVNADDINGLLILAYSQVEIGKVTINTSLVMQAIDSLQMATKLCEGNKT